MSEALWRIGELSRRVGVSPQVLRAWETRYGLLEPRRSAGGYRLYSERDQARVLAVIAYQAQGLSTGEAAERARATPAGPPAPQGQPAARPTPLISSERDGPLAEMRARLLTALVALDESSAQAAMDSLFAAVDLDTALVAGILPVLAAVGDWWARGQVSVADEHYATSIIEARLMGLARGWGAGNGPRVVLAGAPGEQHTIGLLAFGLMLRRRGWRVVYMGASTPTASLQSWVLEHRPDAVVVSAVMAERLVAVKAELRELARHAPLLLGGAGASESLAHEVGAQAQRQDPVATAEMLSELIGE